MDADQPMLLVESKCNRPRIKAWFLNLAKDIIYSVLQV